MRTSLRRSSQIPQKVNCIIYIFLIGNFTQITHKFRYAPNKSICFTAPIFKKFTITQNFCGHLVYQILFTRGT